MKSNHHFNENKARPASLYERFISEIILDGIAQIIICFFIAIMGFILLMILPQKEAVLSVIILCCIIFPVILCYFYQVIPLHRSQFTMGMKVYNLILVDKWGNKPSLLKTLMRQFIYGGMSVLFSLIIYYLINVFYHNYLWVIKIDIQLSIILSITITYLFTLFNKSRRTIHDLIVGTYVIYKEERKT